MEKAICDLTCPKCHKPWGKMAFTYASFVRSSDVKVIAGKRKKFKDGEALACTLCGYQYLNWDVMLAIAEVGRGDGSTQI